MFNNWIFLLWNQWNKSEIHEIKHCEMSVISRSPFNPFISSIPFFENGWNWLKWRGLTGSAAPAIIHFLKRNGLTAGQAQGANQPNLFFSICFLGVERKQMEEKWADGEWSPCSTTQHFFSILFIGVEMKRMKKCGWLLPCLSLLFSLWLHCLLHWIQRIQITE